MESEELEEELCVEGKVTADAANGKSDQEGWKEVVRGRRKVSQSLGLGLQCRVKVESKMFVFAFEENGLRSKGFVEKHSKGFSSWIRLGPEGWALLLEGLELGCTKASAEVWGWSWVEGMRNYFLEQKENAGGVFIRLKVKDKEGKHFSIYFPEGGKRGEGWGVVAKKLRSLGVVPREEKKGVVRGSLSSEVKGQETSSALTEKVVATNRKEVMIEVGEMKVERRLDQLENFLE